MAPLNDTPAGALKIRVKRKIYPASGVRAEQPVLKDIAIDIEPRSFVVLTGPSGCGKSTLLNIIAGLDSEYEGEVALGGPDTRLGYIFQSPRLLPWRTVYENIALALPDGDARHGRIEDMLRQVGLEGFSSQYPERLSLGMQRRAALARGFITEPDVLLMDEPFSALDTPTRRRLQDDLVMLWRETGKTLLFVTHDIDEAVYLADRVIALGGAPGELRASIAIDVARPRRRDDPRLRDIASLVESKLRSE